MDQDCALKQLAEIGRTYPAEFVGAISSQALATACSWLDANGIPEQVKGLFESAWLLARAEKGLASGDFSDMAAVELVEVIADASRGIAELGGQFYDEASVSLPRAPIEWASLQR